MSNFDVYFNDYLLDLKIRRLDEKTIRNYKIDLEQFFNFKTNSTKETKIIKDYISFLSNRYNKAKTIKRKIASLKGFYKYLLYEDIIAESPFNKIQIKIKEETKLPKVISSENIKIILQHLYDKVDSSDRKKRKLHLRNLCLLELMLTTGIRVSELCHIKISDIDIYKKYIKIKGKGNKERIVYFDIYKTNIVFNKYLECIKNNVYLFENRFHKRLNEQSVRLMLKEIEEELHLNQHITPHMFRHTFATGLLAHDVDIRYIQKILGHSSITTTEIYTHVFSNMTKKIMTSFNPRLDY